MPRRITDDPDWLQQARAEGRVTETRVRIDAGHGVAHRVGELPRGKAKVMPGRKAFVELPVPPSTNSLYANAGKKGRVKTKAYKDWQEVAEYCLAGLSIPPGPWSIRYTVCAGLGWPESRDLGNAEKPLTDLLVAVGLIKDDCTRYVRKVSTEYDPEIRGPQTVAVVRVQVSQWNAGAA